MISNLSGIILSCDLFRTYSPESKYLDYWFTHKKTPFEFSEGVWLTF